MITVSSILQHVRRGRIRGIYSVREDFGEVIEAEALETSSLVGKSIRGWLTEWCQDRRNYSS